MKKKYLLIYIDKLGIDRGCDNVEQLPTIRFFLF